jgi:hypothetical protein
MIRTLLILSPLLVLIIWAAIFDLKRRRAPLTNHNIEKASQRARSQADARGASPSGSGDGIAPGA